jgi:hypothetical protein
MVLSPIVKLERSIEKAEKAFVYHKYVMDMQQRKIDELTILLDNTRGLWIASKWQLDFYKRELEVMQHSAPATAHPMRPSNHQE